MPQEEKQIQRYSQEKKPDGSIVIKIIVPAGDVAKVYEKVVDELVKKVELPGFRKGTAPKNIAEEKLNKDTVREEVLKKVLSGEYVAAVKQLGINPIVNPRIHVEQFAEGTNLEFTAETCEQPQIELKNYKDEIRKVTAASKIIVPGKEEKKQILTKS